ncbi:MAG TPA: response regulator [Burkholderiales bacterium]|nr:response regulator [Burkholderiales bacterium]
MDSTVDSRARVLYVDDDEATRHVLARALRDYAAVEARSGEDAIRASNASAFDAYVLDLWLPDYNGILLCRQIRGNDPHVPIVFWTVADDVAIEERALRGRKRVSAKKRRLFGLA